MKHLTTAALLLTFFFCTRAKAQSTTDYFPGKWKVTVYGTPQGDAAMFFLLERKDGKLTQVDEKDKDVTLYFTAQGYDVNITLEPVPADSVKGSLMGMFDAKGIRVKQSK